MRTSLTRRSRLFSACLAAASLLSGSAWAFNVWQPNGWTPAAWPSETKLHTETNDWIVSDGTMIAVTSSSVWTFAWTPTNSLVMTQDLITASGTLASCAWSMQWPLNLSGRLALTNYGSQTYGVTNVARLFYDPPARMRDGYFIDVGEWVNGFNTTNTGTSVYSVVRGDSTSTVTVTAINLTSWAPTNCGLDVIDLWGLDSLAAMRERDFAEKPYGTIERGWRNPGEFYTYGARNLDALKAWWRRLDQGVGYAWVSNHWYDTTLTNSAGVYEGITNWADTKLAWSNIAARSGAPTNWPEIRVQYYIGGYYGTPREVTNTWHFGEPGTSTVSDTWGGGHVVPHPETNQVVSNVCAHPTMAAGTTTSDYSYKVVTNLFRHLSWCDSYLDHDSAWNVGQWCPTQVQRRAVYATTFGETNASEEYAVFAGLESALAAQWSTATWETVWSAPISPYYDYTAGPPVYEASRRRYWNVTDAGSDKDGPRVYITGILSASRYRASGNALSGTNLYPWHAWDLYYPPVPSNGVEWADIDTLGVSTNTYVHASGGSPGVEYDGAESHGTNHYWRIGHKDDCPYFMGGFDGSTDNRTNSIAIQPTSYGEWVKSVFRWTESENGFRYSGR